MATYQLGRRLVAASGVVEAHLGAREGHGVVLSRLAAPWAQDPTFLERFARHAPSLGGVRHPQVAELVEFGAGGDGFWFAERAGDGEPLRALMTSRLGRLSGPEAVAIAAGAASGLSALHDAGLTHGDVSASSLFVTSGGAVVLLHPGVATVAGAHPRRGPARSEPHAVAPDQLTGPSSTSTDIFRLGLVLLELLTGRSLFVAPDPLQVLSLAERFKAVPPGVLADLPPALQSLLGSMLHLRPEERPVASHLPEALLLAGAEGGQGSVAAAFGRLMADRQPLEAARTTELRLTPPRPSSPPPPVARAGAGAAVLGRLGGPRATPSEARAYATAPAAPPPSPAELDALLGQQLVKGGALTAAELAAAVQHAAVLHLSLADALLVDGVLEEDAIVQALATATGTPFLSSAKLALLDASKAPLHLLPHAEAERLLAVPLAERAGTLVVAVADPLDPEVLGKLKRVTGLEVQTARAGERALRAAITRLYGGVTDDELGAWLETGPEASRVEEESFRNRVETAGLELEDSDPNAFELEGRPAARGRAITATGLDEGQTKLVELLLRGFGEPGREATALVQLAGDIARRLNASPTDVDKARFVTAAVVTHNLLLGREPWAPPGAEKFEGTAGPLALPVKALAPTLFDPLRPMPEDLVALAVLCAFGFAQTGKSTCPAPWEPVVAALRAQRFPSIALDALRRVLEA